MGSNPSYLLSYFNKNIFGTFVFVSELRFSSKNKNHWHGKPNFNKTSRKTPPKIKF
jgi:hypothetical protein